MIHLVLVVLQALIPVLLPLLGTAFGSPAHLAASTAAFGLAGLAHAHHARALRK